MKRTSIVLLALLLAMVMIFSGCSQGKNEKDQELTILTGSDFSSFDPQICNDSRTESANRGLYSNLVTFDKDMKIVQDLAEDWGVSDDGLTWTFKLRKGVKFHDGSAFNANAVKVTLERILNPDTGSPNRSILEMISAVNVVDEYTVEITTSTQVGSLLNRLAHPAAAIISPAALEKYGADYALHPSGTGPFKFVEWKVNEYATFERNDDYFGDVAKVKKVTYKIVPDDATRALLLESGEGDIAYGLPSTEVARLQKNENVVVDLSDTLMTMYVPYNLSKDTPLKDVRVRQAINYATNREEIINDVLGGLATLADSPLAPKTWGYKAVGEYEFNLDKAKELMKEAGYENGFEISIWTPKGRYLMDTKVVEVLQQQWAKIGIDCKIQQWETQAMFAELKNAEFDMLYMGWSPSTAEAGRGLDPFNVATTSFNFAHYDNPEVNKLLDDAKQETDDTKRAEMYGQAEQIIWDEAPWNFLYYPKQIVVYQKNVKGLDILADEHVLLNHAYIEK
ncbi:MAG: glutathione ABC transporter substrate-binding protein [Clostridia bacterium]|nr:glutathione ABC transporter substrate-binding protein [Clostridia bacterium]